MADWTEGAAPGWQNPHERTYYREAVPPSHASFNFVPRANANANANPNSNVEYPNSFTGLSPELAEKQRRLQDSLDKVLGPDYVQTRPGGGGAKLTYLEGWRAINLANEVFGYNGWYTDIKYLEVDFCDFSPESHRWSMGVTAIVRVRLPDGASHEDIGYGKLENTKSKGDGLDKCKKEAVTDGLKRALRHFGKLLGNCLYDKNYLSQLSGMKAKKPKFDWDTIYVAEKHALHATDPQYIAPRAQPPAAAAVSPENTNAGASRSNPNTADPGPPSTSRPPPHPAHMQRAQTIGSGVASRPAVGETQKPPMVQAPRRSTTIAHPTAAVTTSLARQQRDERADSVATNGTAEYGLGSEDDSFFAEAMNTTEEERSRGERGASSGTLGENHNVQVGAVRGADDSGFVEASFLHPETVKDTTQRPPAQARDDPRPRPSTTANPSDHQAPTVDSNGSGAFLSLAEQNRLAALARRDAKLKAKVAQQQQQQQQQQATSTSTSTSNIISTTTAVGSVHGSRNQALRPPVAPPPSRTTSVSHVSKGLPNEQHQQQHGSHVTAVPRQAGTLPTLHVGNGIVQAQQAVGSAGSGAAAGGGHGNESTATTTSPGFISARGVKRKSEEGGGGGGGLVKAHTVSTSNPASGNRQPLGELDVTDSGQVKRFRASS